MSNQKGSSPFLILLAVIVVLGIIIYLLFNPVILLRFLPLTENYHDSANKITFNYPLGGSIFIAGEKSDTTPNIINVSVGSDLCDLFIDSGYEEPKPYIVENYNGFAWKKWKLDTFTPSLGSLYDVHSVIWWTDVNNHNYRWQADSRDEPVCRNIVKTFILK